MELLQNQLHSIIFLLFLIALNALFLEQTMRTQNKWIRLFIYFTHGPISLTLATIQIIHLFIRELSTGLIMLLTIMDKLMNIYILLGFGSVLLLLIDNKFLLNRNEHSNEGRESHV